MKRVLLLSGACAAGFAVTALVATHPHPSTPPIPTPPAHTAHLAKIPPIPTVMHAPARLKIPALGIDHEIQRVTTLANGEMATPHDMQKVGWYGVEPGNPGKAVLAAHAGLPNAPTVFAAFAKLAPGNTFQVQDEQGNVAVFEVIDTARYTPAMAPPGAHFWHFAHP